MGSYPNFPPSYSQGYPQFNRVWKTAVSCPRTLNRLRSHTAFAGSFGQSRHTSSGTPHRSSTDENQRSVLRSPCGGGLRNVLSLIKVIHLPIAVLEVHLTLTNEQNRLAGKTSFAPSAMIRNTSMKSIKLSVLGLALTLVGGITVLAQDQPTTPATPAKPEAPAPVVPKKPVQQQLSGKVVAVDKVAKTITLQVNNLTYVLEIADSTRVSKAGKERSLIDVIVGEEISVTVLLRELPNGRVEVAVLSVDLSESSEAQGSKEPKLAQPAPFQNGPNPANIDGPIISPHR